MAGMENAPVRVGPGFENEFPGADPVAAEAGANLARTNFLWMAELARRRRVVADLSPSGFQALAILEGAGEPLPSTVIADRLLVSTASMTSLLDTLERRGLVVRDAHPRDRRKILVRLTDAGYAVVDRMLPIVHAAATDVFGTLTRAERETLVDLLGRVQHHLAELAGRPVPAPQPRRPPRLRTG
jgi:DNA-binding MarR family transcriptional regulator